MQFKKIISKFNPDWRVYVDAPQIECALRWLPWRQRLVLRRSLNRIYTGHMRKGTMTIVTQKGSLTAIIARGKQQTRDRKVNGENRENSGVAWENSAKNDIIICRFLLSISDDPKIGEGWNYGSRQREV